MISKAILEIVLRTWPCIIRPKPQVCFEILDLFSYQDDGSGLVPTFISRDAT